MPIQAPSRTFCWLPPERVRTGLRPRSGGDAEFADRLGRRFVQKAIADDRPPAQRGQAVGREVRADGKIQEEALGLAVLRQVADPEVDGLAGRGGGDKSNTY